MSMFLEFKLHVQGRSPQTIQLYERGMRLLKQSLGEVRLTDATLVHLHAFSGKFLHDIGIKPRARKPFVSSVREFYKYLHSTKVLPENRAAELPYPRFGRPLPEAMEYRWAEKLLMAPDMNTYIGMRDVLIFMLLGMGLRVSGLCGMNESSLRFNVNSNGTETLTVRVREKGKAERYVPMPPEVWVMMRSYLAHPFLDEVDRAIDNGDKILFVGFNNRTVKKDEYRGEKLRLTKGGVRYRLSIYARRLKMPKQFAHPHALRHMFGMAMADAGLDTLAIMNLMGHRDAETAELYHHISEKLRREQMLKANPFQRIKTTAGQLLEAARRAA